MDTWLRGVPTEWLQSNEGPETWSPFDVVGHLVHGEQTDWITRVKIILKHGESRAFDPFDRFAQFEKSRGKSMDDLLDEFASLRAQNLAELDGLGIGTEDYVKKGKHPELGVCTLGQYAGEVGPWREYLPILRPRAKN
jgi:hypothetical protein